MPGSDESLVFSQVFESVFNRFTVFLSIVNRR